jgi:CheY-like chemotaxis protein
VKTKVKSHILIADDEKHTRLALDLVLRQAGFQVSVATDGHEAFETVIRQAGGKNPVTLIITDVFMPRIDGLKLLELLNNQGFAIPVIVITGYGNSELILKLRSRGFAGYLDKPFVPEEILSRVSKVLEENVTPLEA